MSSRLSAAGRTVIVAAGIFILAILLVLNTPSYSEWPKIRYYDSVAAHSEPVDRHGVKPDDHGGHHLPEDATELDEPTFPLKAHSTATDTSTTTSTSTHDATQTSPTASSSSSEPKCRLTKVSMLYGAHVFPQMLEALTTHRLHSERWGCGFTTLQRDLTDRRLYSKQYYLLSIMLQELAKPEAERQQWLLWVDADSIVLNPALSPELFLPPPDLNLDRVHALVTADKNGLNAGIFYLKVDPASVDLMTRTVAYPLEHPDVDLGWFGEQAAMANVIKEIEANASAAAGHYPGIAWVPRDWFNLYQTEDEFQGEPGDVHVHFAGLGATRLDHMQNWLDELQTDRGKWEVPLEKTRFKDGVREFWGQFVANYTDVSGSEE